MTQEMTKTVPKALARYFSECPKVAVAFSGGVDSSYLLYAAIQSGADVMAYYVSSQFQPRFELEDAKRLARDVGARMKILLVDALSSPTVVSNPPDRCYHCKNVVFGTILDHAAAEGYSVIMDGTNLSDDAGDRPGMRALAELKIRSPLRETGLRKEEIRELSRRAGLFTWDKPSYACLATRIPTGVALDGETLGKVEGAEEALAGLGFTDFRARVLGTAAKLQLPAEEMPLAIERRKEIVEALSAHFTDVLLDLKPR